MATRLFLLSEMGPTKLMFKNDQDQKLTISLSTKITCSLCHPKSTKASHPRCKHILFCLIKVFKLDRKSELLFKETLTAENLNFILEGRYKEHNIKASKFSYLKKKKLGTGDQDQEEKKDFRSIR